MQKILIIDDDEIILDIFKLILIKYNYNVDVASTTKDATKLLKNKYDYVFVDYFMEEQNTLNLIKEIFKYYNSSNVCVVTGLEDIKEFKMLKKIGINNILKKPITAMEIIDFINRNNNMKIK